MEDYKEKCWRCGKELICHGNFMISDWEGIDMNEDDDAMITDYYCPFCGMEYSITDTPRNQMKIIHILKIEIIYEIRRMLQNFRRRRFCFKNVLEWYIYLAQAKG
jgi:hypothetical protein